MNLMIPVFRDVTPHSLVEVYLTFCLNQVYTNCLKTRSYLTIIGIKMLT